MELLREIARENTNREKVERVKRARDDFFYFCKTYLAHYFAAETAEYQRVLIDIANSRSLDVHNMERLKKFIPECYHGLMQPCERIETIVDIEPRGFSKSTRWSLAYPLWQLIFKHSQFICIFCASQDKANEALQNIKDEIESNELLFGDFGKLEGDVWKSNFLTFKNGTAIRAYGAGVAVRGARYREHRPDLIICDDILKDDSTRTFAQRQKIYSWFLRAVLPLGQNIFTIIINTIFHSDDLPSRLLKRIGDGELENWVGFRFRCFTESGESLWPEYWTIEKLNAKKVQLGSAAFNTEYMNEPLSDEERAFKEEWFQYYASIESSKSLRVYMGVDPSVGKHDEFAICILGFGDNGKIYVLDTWAETASVDRSVNKLIEKFLMFKPALIGFEEVAFQSIYKKYIVEEAGRRGVYLPIRGMSTRGVGKERILSLSPLIENGIVLFKENQKKLVEQLTQYPKSEYDDLQDALYYAFAIGSGSGKGEVASSRTSRLMSALRQVFR